jgi:hypothetical protein
MNPLTGRFWSMDEYEGSETDPVSLQKYLYTGADPANGIDPSGHETLVELQVATAIDTNLAKDKAEQDGYRIRRAQQANKVAQVFLCVGQGRGSGPRFPQIGHAFIWLRQLTGQEGFVWDVNPDIERIPGGLATKPGFDEVVPGILNVRGPMTEGLMERAYKPIVKVPFGKLNVGQVAIWGISASTLAYGPGALLETKYQLGAPLFGETVSCYSWAISAAVLSAGIQFLPTGF